MSAIAWIAAVSLTAWGFLLLGQGFFWRTDQRLPPREAPPVWPSVALVVPARDEADMLPVSLPSLLAQDYPGRAEIFLVDDSSTDGTGALARELADRLGGLPLTVLSPPEPAPGWTGKLWALRHGIELARAERPDYLLLTDADIAHEPDSLRELVAAATTNGLDLVSQMARLRVATAWERLIVPAFVYFFSQLYPFRRVNKAGARTAAAAGGCVLLRTGAAERARIPDSIRQAVIDDVSLARAVRKAGDGSGSVSRSGGQRAAVSETDRSVADGGAQRVRPAPAQPAAAHRHRDRPRGHLSGAARGGVRGPGGR